MKLVSASETSPSLSALQMMVELAWASWETIIRRSLMIAQNTCSTAEYHSMFNEKTSAILETGSLLTTPDRSSAAALLAPWHSRATANARRLRG